MSHGSGVVVAPGRMVTNCHVLARAKAIQIKREAVTHDVTLEHADVERDLCLLTIPASAAPSVEIADLSTVKVGHRAYVVGNPERFALTLSEGLISALRPEESKLPPIQTSAPISSGSSGGGLFDDQARLVGITTLTYLGRERTAQNLNFAMPAEWIRQIPDRARAQLARWKGVSPETAPSASPTVGAVASAGPRPRVGDEWKYSFRDQKYASIHGVFTARVTAIDGAKVDELMRFEGTSDLPSAIDTEQVRFSTISADGRMLVELSPYLLSRNGGEVPKTLGLPSDYPVGVSGEPFRVRLESIGQEDIAVPFGSFKTIRIEVSGERSGRDFGAMAGIRWNPYFVARFRYTVWYAPRIARYVQARHMQWNPGGELTGDEIVQLLEYRKN